MKCHYAVLDVAPDASADDIKRAYRRQALTHHPDKHAPERREEATAYFRLIQQAYEVLSDEQERAWYDRHRAEILRSDHPRGGPTAAASGGDHGGVDEDLVDVMAYFTSSAYDSMDDSPRGFFTVYRDVFDALRSQELQFREYYASSGFRTSGDEVDDDGDAAMAVPWTTFGSTSTTDYKQLTEFYAYWTNFSTAVRFEWCDQYALRQAKNRSVRRMMEKENKRLRSAARREYNESVRALALYVQKRDARYQRLAEEAKAARETKAALQAAARSREKAERDREMISEYREQEWMKVPEERLNAAIRDGINEFTSRDDSNQDRSDTANDEEAEETEDRASDASADSIDPEGIYCVACSKSFRSDKQFANHERSKKHIKNVKALRHQILEEERQYGGNAEGAASDDQLSGDEEFYDATEDELFSTAAVDAGDNADTSPVEAHEKISAALAPAGTIEPTSDEGNSDNDDDDNSETDLSSRLKQQATVSTVGDHEGHEDHVEDSKQQRATTAAAKKPGARRRRHKGGGKADDNTAAAEWRCNVCLETFDSRNRMFDHIKREDHAQAPAGKEPQQRRKPRRK